MNYIVIFTISVTKLQNVSITATEALWQQLLRYLAVSLSVFTLLSDPVDGVEVVVGSHAWNGLLQQVQQVGGDTGPASASSIRHGVVRP